MNVTRWFNNGTNVPQHAIDKIMNHLARVRRHEFLGVLSVECGYGLSQTMAIVQHMCTAGSIRWLTDDEKRDIGISETADVLIAVQKTKL